MTQTSRSYEHGPRATGRATPPSFGRRVLSGLLWTVTAVLLIVGIAAVVSVFGAKQGGAASGAVWLFLLALFTGSAARAVGERARRTTAVRDKAPKGGGDDRVSLVTLPGIDPGVRYRERCSQLPLAGAILAAAILVTSVLGLVALDGPNGAGAGAWGAILFAAAAICVIYLLVVLIGAPNGIKFSEGRFTLGTLGVPPAGMQWRRITGPVDAVRGWDVVSAQQARRIVSARSRSGRRRQSLGDLRLFNQRAILYLELDPGSVEASFPSRVQRGYTFVSAPSAGLFWNGVVLIGTRRPAALAAALQQALPGRRRTEAPEVPNSRRSA